MEKEMGQRAKENEILLMKPFIPSLQEFQPYLNRIWESRWLTNSGPIEMELEEALCDFLGVNYISLFANGTLALMIALKALNLKGEVVTTPFTHAATIQALYWNNLNPVFVDINEHDLNIDVSKIEGAITENTTAILPVHIFGNPCNVDQIKKIALKHNLKVVFDAAHSFGVQVNGTSICNFGDISVLSFHATKVINSIEGGAIICHNEVTKKKIDTLKNNGLVADNKFVEGGLNAKINEMQCAFALLQLKHIGSIINKRKAASGKYRKLLKRIRGLRTLRENEFVKYNYSFFPIIVNPDEFGTSRDELYDYLKNKNIVTRKYFYPLVSDFPDYETGSINELSVATEIAEKILCIPLFHDIVDEQIEYVVNSIIQLHTECSG